ncbi:hypothetical protein COK86_26065 [Bacillus cereus]|uniref:Uncharacterized protein n=1 Tax=Bacillus cereus TaxID=1396 RepID=A0A2B3TV50_BACCE|nr:hypothetical protein COK86_26065 [Bacillus cereus]
MYVEQLRWLPAIPCPKPMHLPPTHFAFLEEGVFLAKMIKYRFLITFYNTVGICANCHRKLHILNLHEDVAKLEKKLARYK